MPYETASATGPNDLLDKLRIFAVASGWTAEYTGPRTNPGGGSQGNGLNALGLRKAGQSWMLYHDTASPSTTNPSPRMQGYIYTGPFVASAGTDLQANRSGLVTANHLPGPYVAYHFFTDSARTYLHVALEVTSGRFSHFMLGLFNGVGSTAAAYCAGVRWDFSAGPTSNPLDGGHSVPFDALSSSSSLPGGGVVRADSDGVVPRYFAINSTVAVVNGKAVGGVRSASGEAISRLLMHVPPSQLTGRAVLAPPLIAVSRASDLQRSLLGAPHDLRWLRMDNITPGDAITIGSDTWRAFPLVRKNGAPGIENSGTFGYAYRVVT